MINTLVIMNMFKKILNNGSRRSHVASNET